MIIFVLWQEEAIEKADQFLSEIRRREEETKNRDQEILRKIVRLTYSC